MHSPRDDALNEMIRQGIELLKGGGVIAFPTDTVYGVGAHAFIDTAVRRIYNIKARPIDKPLALLIADSSQMSQFAQEVPEVALRLAERFFPGGLTLVLKRSPAVATAAAGGETIAVRVPDHPIALALIRGIEAPLATTSANVSGRPAPVTADEVCEQIGHLVDLVIDGGRCPGAMESTVVDVSGKTPRLLREGAIPRKEIEGVCGELDVDGEGS